MYIKCCSVQSRYDTALRTDVGGVTSLPSDISWEWERGWDLQVTAPHWCRCFALHSALFVACIWPVTTFCQLSVALDQQKLQRRRRVKHSWVFVCFVVQRCQRAASLTSLSDCSSLSSSTHLLSSSNSSHNMKIKKQIIVGNVSRYVACCKYCFSYCLSWGWWSWALVSPDGVALSQMVSMSASVNLPLHHKVQKFSSGTDSSRWSLKKGCKMVVVCGGYCLSLAVFGIFHPCFWTEILPLLLLCSCTLFCFSFLYSWFCEGSWVNDFTSML